MSTPTNNDDILDFGSDPFDGQVETISALDGDDSIIGTNFDDVIFGGDGADTITSNGAFQGFPGGPPAGGDVVYGGDGDDVITTELSSVPGLSSSIGDTVFGGAGNDFILGAVAGAASATDTLDGGLGNDTIDGNGGLDIINAGLGNDTVIARAGADTVDGGDGVDTLDLSKDALSVIIDLATGATTAFYVGAPGGEFETNTNFENVLGTAGDDVISGDVQDNSLVGALGDDTLLGGAGSDIFVAGGGDDTVTGGDEGGDVDTLDYSSDPNGVTVIYDGDESGEASGTSAGTDVFSQIERLVLSDLDDSVNAFADTAGVTIEFGDGNDFVRPGLGTDSLDGGDGIDGIGFFDSAEAVQIDLTGPIGTGTGGNVTGDSFINFESYILTDFEDSFLGSGDGETVDGSVGNDDLRAGEGNDTVIGGGGNDLVEGGAGADSLSGGSGVDTLAYFGSAAGVSVSLETGLASGGDAEGDDFTEGNSGRVTFENLIGSAQGDFLQGSIGINEIFGDGGNDTIEGLGSGDKIFGGAGDDSLSGDEGNDLIRGGIGADVIDGGSGRDTVDYSDSSDAVFVLLDVAAIGGDAQGDQLSGIEGVIGSEFVDFIAGNNGANDLFGGGEADYIQGKEGNDGLFGGDGDDVLEGGTGGDTLDGGEGIDFISALDATGPVTIDLGDMSNSSAGFNNDVLISIEAVIGADGLSNTLTGDSGANQIVGGQQADVLDGAGGNDLLAGFAGDDQLLGGAGRDTFFSGLGDDTMTGGSGTDTFLFEFDDGDNVLTDLVQGELLVFTGAGFTDESDVTVGEVSPGGNVLLSWGAVGALSSVEILNIDQATFEADFNFLVFGG